MKSKTVWIILGVIILLIIISRIIKVSISSSRTDSLSGKYCMDNPKSRDENGKCRVPLLYSIISK